MACRTELCAQALARAFTPAARLTGVPARPTQQEVHLSQWACEQVLQAALRLPARAVYALVLDPLLPSLRCLPYVPRCHARFAIACSTCPCRGCPVPVLPATELLCGVVRAVRRVPEDVTRLVRFGDAGDLMRDVETLQAAGECERRRVEMQARLAGLEREVAVLRLRASRAEAHACRTASLAATAPDTAVDYAARVSAFVARSDLQVKEREVAALRSRVEECEAEELRRWQQVMARAQPGLGVRAAFHGRATGSSVLASRTPSAPALVQPTRRTQLPQEVRVPLAMLHAHWAQQLRQERERALHSARGPTLRASPFDAALPVPAPHAHWKQQLAALKIRSAVAIQRAWRARVLHRRAIQPARAQLARLRRERELVLAAECEAAERAGMAREEERARWVWRVTDAIVRGREQQRQLAVLRASGMAQHRRAAGVRRALRAWRGTCAARHAAGLVLRLRTRRGLAAWLLAYRVVTARDRAARALQAWVRRRMQHLRAARLRDRMLRLRRRCVLRLVQGTLGRALRALAAHAARCRQIRSMAARRLRVGTRAVFESWAEVARAEVTQRLWAVDVLQRAVRAWLSRRRRAELILQRAAAAAHAHAARRRAAAACTLQRVVRGWAARRRVARMRSRAALVRQHALRLWSRRCRTALALAVAAWRRVARLRAMCRYMATARAIKDAGALFAAWRDTARAAVRARHAAAVRLQALARGVLTRARLRHAAAERAAAVAIQRVWRGGVTRRRVAEARLAHRAHAQRRERAALLLQRVCRGWRSRCRVALVRDGRALAPARSGDVRAVRALLAAGGASLRDEQGDTALHAAAHYGWQPVARACIRHGMDINVTNVRCVVLHCALVRACARAIMLPPATLLTMRPQFAGRTALHVAAALSPAAAAPALVRYLLSKGANPELLDAQGCTPLIAAAAAGRLQCVIALLTRPCLFVFDPCGRSALHAAAAAGHAPVCTAVAHAGAGARRGAFAVPAALGLPRLTSQRADPLQPDAHGVTPLHLAAGHGHVAAMRALLQRVGALAAADSDAPAAPSLEAAEELAAVASAQGMARACARQAVDGDTPLHCAARGGHAQAALLLLDSGAACSVQSARGRTALHEAAAGCHTQIVQLLCEADAEVRSRAHVLCPRPAPHRHVLRRRWMRVMRRAPRRCTWRLKLATWGAPRCCCALARRPTRRTATAALPRTLRAAMARCRCAMPAAATAAPCMRPRTRPSPPWRSCWPPWHCMART